MEKATAATIRAEEAAHFARLAGEWWDPQGSSAMLHRLNPVRLQFIRSAIDAHWGTDPAALRPLAARRALDVGCGGGLLCEPLARMGFAVTGLDAARENVAVAQAHAAAMGLAVDYRAGSAEALAAAIPGSFDLVTCLEVIEHVADLASFLAALERLLAPDGLLIFSTPNRTPQSYAMLIVGAERLLRSIPEGAHDWEKFLTPPELTAALADAGLKVTHLTGLGYRLSRGFVIGDDTSVNYIGTAVRA